MVSPTCPHCKSNAFELQETPDIQGAAFTYAIVRCAGCGAPIGVLEDENIDATLAEQSAKIDDLAEAISRIEKIIESMASDLHRVRENTRK
jgi:hypothetical protein